MRLLIVGALVAVVGCSGGAEPADYAATGGQDAGAAGGSSGAGGAPGSAGGSAAASCNIALAQVNGDVTSATSSGVGAGSGPLAEFQACASTGANDGKFVKTIVNGQPPESEGTPWQETALAVALADGGCAVSIDYARTLSPWDGGATCDETLSVTLTVQR